MSADAPQADFLHSSPDGRHIGFVAAPSEETSEVWTAAADRLTCRRLERTRPLDREHARSTSLWITYPDRRGLPAFTRPPARGSRSLDVRAIRRSSIA